MSIQFGIWNLDGRPVDPGTLESAQSAFAHYSCDSTHSYVQANVGILYRSFHTTQESRSETQPHILSTGAVITWDGRLDHRAELVSEFPNLLTLASSDVEIVAAAYERWGTDCLKRLIGDWALAVWDSASNSLILAKDFLGLRHLYYCGDDKQITWSTTLDPLVHTGKKLALSEEYIAGCLSFFPSTHLTPFVGVHSVPPSSFVLLSPGNRTIHQYWDFDSSKRVRYGSDAEYEEHFWTLFAEAVEQRLRCDTPILAELSGGMDSSSIVCMADRVLARGGASTPRLDTISYCSDSEPNWDERPYFTKVEEQRGRPGCHIDVSTPAFLAVDNDSPCLTPGAAKQNTAARRQFEERLLSQGNRVLLSGVGGDEVTGGVPTPLPELEDLMANAQLGALAHKLKLWALNKRKPWFHLLFDALRGFFPPRLVSMPKHRQPSTWLDCNFVQRNKDVLLGYQKRIKFFGPMPSFQENLATLDGIRRQLACSSLPTEPTYEKRYPFLDRCLLEFLFAVPREQLVRPGMRRSLMRRALVGIVPSELLNRKRKAVVSRGPRVGISAEWPTLISMTQSLVSSSVGIVDSDKLLYALQKARRGEDVPIVLLLRTMGIEHWLRNLCSQGIAIDIDRASIRSNRQTRDCAVLGRK
jgi:asparagine synthase (glutamine-hydrolysing)